MIDGRRGRVEIERENGLLRWIFFFVCARDFYVRYARTHTNTREDTHNTYTQHTHITYTQHSHRGEEVRRIQACLISSEPCE